ncbi:recombinase family protein [Streptomyces hygroscopicus]|uniref:recombinase family protein n=1 Tax=Streptomyces hygroscopicus TaxID=1912 RepID=UPI00069131DD|nr:recombinase family protein [Streptomyces hygroscopicus]
MARVLGILRLSRDGENSTSIERQRDRIEQWADFNGHTIVGWAEDVDVSGGVAPWERAELGKWLPNTIGARVPEREEQMAWNASRAGEWDIACAWKLDRISRRVLHIVQLGDWARQNRKALASVDDGFDFTTEMGRLLFTLLAAFAEGELTAIKARQRSSRCHLSQVGRYAGSTPPFGYRAEPAEDGEGFVLVPDETGTATAKVVREMARMILKEEKSVNAVALWLNETGQHKAKDAQLVRKGREPKGSKWAGKDVTSILRSEVILGRSYRTETIETPEGETVERVRVTDAEGMPLQRADALLSEEDFAPFRSSSTATRASAPATGATVRNCSELSPVSAAERGTATLGRTRLTRPTGAARTPSLARARQLEEFQRAEVGRARSYPLPDDRGTRRDRSSGVRPRRQS